MATLKINTIKVLTYLFSSVIPLSFVLASEDFRIVSLEQGDVKGTKFWGGDYYEFYGIPYANVPKGRDRFKGPLPATLWKGVLEATNKDIQCTQLLYTGNDDDSYVIGQEDCLVINLFIPKVANENNLRPVIVYIHSGAFALGHGNMAGYKYLLKHDVIVASINYRLGAIGFACLGNKDIPGNAGMKDQAAALKWINKNIEKFGGDPSKVTVAGFSVGAAMAELLTLSNTTKGLFDKVILESGSALAPWAVNNHPIQTATNIAVSLGYNNTGKLQDLTEFYLKTDPDVLAKKSVNFFLKNGTFGFAPCIENDFMSDESFLTQSPLDTLISGKQNNKAVLTGFSNMEGISRIDHYEVWSKSMEEHFEDFLPVDLNFPNYKEKEAIIELINKYYFNNDRDLATSLKGYVNYSSDFMFKYAILRSAKLHAAANKSVFLYEFSHIGKFTTRHNYEHIIKGASHRDQTAYILDFIAYTRNNDDMDTRDRLTLMWADFAEYENPTEYETSLIKYKWPRYDAKNHGYLHINTTVEVRKDLTEDSFKFWDKIYDKYYFNPAVPQNIPTYPIN